jgi:hypothetical protein
VWFVPLLAVSLLAPARVRAATAPETAPRARMLVAPELPA